MADTAPYFSPKARRFSVRCQGLTVETLAQGRFEIIITKPAPAGSRDQDSCRRMTKVLPLMPSSGPFFVYADTKKASEDNRVNRRFSVVSLEHHKKVDHA